MPRSVFGVLPITQLGLGLPLSSLTLGILETLDSPIATEGKGLQAWKGDELWEGRVRQGAGHTCGGRDPAGSTGQEATGWKPLPKGEEVLRQKRG